MPGPQLQRDASAQRGAGRGAGGDAGAGVSAAVRTVAKTGISTWFNAAVFLDLCETMQIPANPLLVNAINRAEATYWCGLFGCNRLQLLNAVAAVGNQVSEVKKHVQRDVYQPSPLER